MEHVAIMRKSWGLTRKILTGQKKIESRWYMSRQPPWNMIKQGESVYFKDSGEPVTIRAEVEKVIQLSGLGPGKVKRILDRYGKGDGIEKNRMSEFFEMFKGKRYCMLIFLRNAERVQPFEINKTGFGSMSAWICTEDIDRIKVR